MCDEYKPTARDFDAAKIYMEQDKIKEECLKAGERVPSEFFDRHRYRGPLQALLQVAWWARPPVLEIPNLPTKKDAIYVRVWFPTSNVIVKADLLKSAAFADDFEMVALLSFLQRNIGQVAYFVPLQRSPQGLSTLITMSSSTPLRNWCSPMPSSPPSRCFIKRRCSMTASPSLSTNFSAIGS